MNPPPRYINRYPKHLRQLLAVAFAWFACVCVAVAAEPIRVDVSRDAWISAYPSEQEGNNGASHKLKLKGIQEFSLIDFDPTPLRGRRVTRAELVVRVEGDAHLDRVTVSTVMTPWTEGNGDNYDRNTDGASFHFAQGKTRPWADGASDLTSVTLGNGGSQWCFGDSSPPDSDRRQRIPIDPAIVQARIDGQCHGFLLVDDLGSEYERNGNQFTYHLMPNRFLASTEKNRSQAPYFLLWFADQDAESPANATPDTDASDPNASDPNASGPEALAVNAAPSQVKELLAAIQNTLPPDAWSSATAPISPRLLNTDFQPLAAIDLGLARRESLTFVVDAPPEQVRVNAPPAFVVELAALPAIGQRGEPAVHDPVVPVGWWNDPQWTLGRGSTTKTAVDVYVGDDVAPGQYPLVVQIGENKLTLDLTVWQFAIPNRLRFIPQMNCYGLPEGELDYFRLCHDHRTTLNRLRYGWTGKVNTEAVPRVQADGSWDWTQWDQHFAPLLDGSAFANSKRGPIPIEAFYLPLNENWPMDHEQFFRGGYWIEDAYPDAYWSEFRSAAKRFAEHCSARGYNETLFEFYLNNKVYFKEQRGGRWDGCSAAWVFDEPVNTQDFWALRRFGQEFWRGVEGIKGPKFAFRVDISRPQWQRDLLDGVSNVEIVSGALRQYGQRVIQRGKKFDNFVYMYGSASPLNAPCSTNVAWCVETWSRGGVGVVPWQTIGNERSWQTPDPLSVIYPSSHGPVASLRLKSFRAGQQYAEFLEMLQDELGNEVTQTQLGDALLNELQLAGQTIKANETDAGSVKFESSTGMRLRKFRYQLGSWLHTERKNRSPAPSPHRTPRQGLSPQTPHIEPIKLHP